MRQTKWIALAAAWAVTALAGPESRALVFSTTYTVTWNGESGSEGVYYRTPFPLSGTLSVPAGSSSAAQAKLTRVNPPPGASSFTFSVPRSRLQYLQSLRLTNGTSSLTDVALRLSDDSYAVGTMGDIMARITCTADGHTAELSIRIFYSSLSDDTIAKERRHYEDIPIDDVFSRLEPIESIYAGTLTTRPGDLFIPFRGEKRLILIPEGSDRREVITRVRAAGGQDLTLRLPYRLIRIGNPGPSKSALTETDRAWLEPFITEPIRLPRGPGFDECRLKVMAPLTEPEAGQLPCETRPPSSP